MHIADPEVRAGYQHVEADDRHDDAADHGVGVLVRVHRVGDPRDDGPDDQQQRPPLDEHDGHLPAVTAGPPADVDAVVAPALELGEPAQDGVQLDGRGHVEELSGPPLVVGGDLSDLVGLLRLVQIVAERQAAHDAVVEQQDDDHETHHGHGLEVEENPEERGVVVEADPEKRRPEPYEVGQVVYADQDPGEVPPREHEVGVGPEVAAARERLDAAPTARREAVDQPAQQADRVVHEHAHQHDRQAPHDADSEHREPHEVAVVFHEGGEVLAEIAQHLDRPRGHLFHADGQLHVGGDEELQPSQHKHEEYEAEPDPVVPVVEHRLQAQRHPALGPALRGGQVAGGLFGHAVGELPVDVLGPLVLEDRPQAARGVLDLAVLVEIPNLHGVLGGLKRPVDDLHRLAFPDLGAALGVPLDVVNPRAVRPARGDAPAAVPDHAVQAEERGVVRVEEVRRVVLLREVLRALAELHHPVAHDWMIGRFAIMEKVRDRRLHEIRLVLVPGVGDAEQERLLPVDIPIFQPHVFLDPRHHVVHCEVQPARLAAAGPQRHPLGVFYSLPVLELRGPLTAPQPGDGRAILGQRVAPHAGLQPLRFVRAVVLVGVRARQVVHEERAPHTPVVVVALFGPIAAVVHVLGFFPRTTFRPLCLHRRAGARPCAARSGDRLGAVLLQQVHLHV
mmetsp:Transcript_106893/g.302263  ORF Transcript_106893/g.302263 Transcript_106893/m.302263 type:complete len:677 (+) Transcript_106893:279-2309(+)